MDSMKIVILCGGKGTRAYPFTEHLPKVMMPVNGTPILIHLMRLYAAQGFNDFVLAAGHHKEMLFDYFEGRDLGWKVNIIDTGADADTGDRIFRCGAHVGDRFMATYGDGLGNVDLHGLLSAHKASGAAATLGNPACRRPSRGGCRPRAFRARLPAKLLGGRCTPR